MWTEPSRGEVPWPAALPPRPGLQHDGTHDGTQVSGDPDEGVFRLNVREEAGLRQDKELSS